MNTDIDNSWLENYNDYSTITKVDFEEFNKNTDKIVKISLIFSAIHVEYDKSSGLEPTSIISDEDKEKFFSKYPELDIGKIEDGVADMLSRISATPLIQPLARITQPVIAPIKNETSGIQPVIYSDGSYEYPNIKPLYYSKALKSELLGVKTVKTVKTLRMYK